MTEFRYYGDLLADYAFDEEELALDGMVNAVAMEQADGAPLLWHQGRLHDEYEDPNGDLIDTATGEPYWADAPYIVQERLLEFLGMHELELIDPEDETELIDYEAEVIPISDGDEVDEGEEPIVEDEDQIAS